MLRNANLRPARVPEWPVVIAVDPPRRFSTFPGVHVYLTDLPLSLVAMRPPHGQLECLSSSPVDRCSRS
jgi:hypothetical protein